MSRKLQRVLLSFSAFLMVLVIVGTQIAVTASAKKPEESYNPVLHFTRIVGTLDGAIYEIFMPDNWNGMLVVGCRGYSHDPSFNVTASPMHGFGMLFMSDEDPERWAFAWSTYGEGGFCIQKAMIRTHQLTKYIIGKYKVQGNVFLMGFSMGGLISCMLAEKYPNLYDGVLDVCGPKDMTSQYYYKKTIANLATPNDIRNYLKGPPANLPESFVATLSNAQLLGVRMFNNVSSADIEIECGGTPETKPKAFERCSPTYHADISVPVVSVIGELDFTVPIFQFDMYYDAVEEAGSLDYYRSYTITGGGHCDATVMAAVHPHWELLVDWVVSGVVPASTPPPIP